MSESIDYEKLFRECAKIIDLESFCEDSRQAWLIPDMLRRHVNDLREFNLDVSRDISLLAVALDATCTEPGEENRLVTVMLRRISELLECEEKVKSVVADVFTQADAELSERATEALSNHAAGIRFNDRVQLIKSITISTLKELVSIPESSLAVVSKVVHNATFARIIFEGSIDHMLDDNGEPAEVTVPIDILVKRPPKTRYQCHTCGNHTLCDTPPDNSLCGGCKELRPEGTPDWRIMRYQAAYIAGTEDWIHPDGVEAPDTTDV